MVTLREQADEQLIIVRPNRSSDWQINKRILFAVAALNLAIAAGFATIGAWVILPFAGLEVLALLTALYWVNWKLTYQHVMHFQGDKLRIEKGIYHPRQSWCWPRENSRLLITVPERSDAALQISLSNGSEQVRIGEFLSADDSRQLMTQLRRQGLRVRNYSTASSLGA